MVFSRVKEFMIESTASWDCSPTALAHHRVIISTSTIFFRNLLWSRNGMMQEPVFDAFQRYLNSNNTSERHQELASLALQTCDALNVISLLPGSRTGAFFGYPDSHYQLFWSLVNNEHTPDYKPTVKDRAVIMGLSMAVGFNEPLKNDTDNTDELRWEDWKTHREPHISTRPPWRCGAHLAEKRYYSRAQAIQLFSTKDINPQAVSMLCEKYSSDSPACDGSVMAFEIPEVRFRLVLARTQKRHEGVFEATVFIEFLGGECPQDEVLHFGKLYKWDKTQKTWRNPEQMTSPGLPGSSGGEQSNVSDEGLKLESDQGNQDDRSPENPQASEDGTSDESGDDELRIPPRITHSLDRPDWQNDPLLRTLLE
ncbi:hypothetical protein HDK90DRAFT_234802 [Phyllosticta capitalensis]|uniref:Uncharacterized protein n=1 Tax=Phyllosticta capitalensis TaxID=121624 RepID=A0ABR1YPL2_9PEZI